MYFPRCEPTLSDPEVTLPAMVARRAKDNPDRILFHMVSGEQESYGTFHESVLTWADAFRRLGVGRENVATMLPTSIDPYRAWLGLAWVGATEVSLNTDYR